MSSTSSLVYIQQYLTRYGMTTYLILGDIGLLFNIAVFSQPAHRRNPCSLYILVMSLCAFIGLNISVIPIIYGLNHPDPLTIFSLFCQLQRYLRHTFNQIMRTFFVLTCADRYVISSDYVRIRSFSQFRIAMRIIPSVIIFWFILAFFPTMVGSIVTSTCSTNNGLYAILNSTYFPAVVGILPLVCMITFGILLYKNLTKMRRRIQPIINVHRLSTNRNPPTTNLIPPTADINPLTTDQKPPTTNVNPLTTNLNSPTANVNPPIPNVNLPINHLLRKRDRDMLRMLLIEIMCHIITTAPITVMLTYSAITRTATKSNDQRQIESFASFVNNTFIFYMNNCFSFWVYICASRSFRLEFKNLMIKFYGFIIGKPIRLHDVN